LELLFPTDVKKRALDFVVVVVFVDVDGVTVFVYCVTVFVFLLSSPQIPILQMKKKVAQETTCEKNKVWLYRTENVSKRFFLTILSFFVSLSNEKSRLKQHFCL